MSVSFIPQVRRGGSRVPAVRDGRFPRRARRLLAASLLLASSALAGPFVPPGDPALRADIQTLGDHGVITGPVTSWPLAWGPILADIDEALAVTEPDLPEHVLQAAARVRGSSRAATRSGARYRAKVAVAEEPTAIRSFANTPRESGQLGAGLAWTGDRLYADLNVQAVDAIDGDRELRADGSSLGVLLGNFAITAGAVDRWWGPGWDGSLILSNNARPIPSLAIDRVFTEPFESRWLGWFGAWDFTMTFGRLESDRAVPDAQHFGLRFAFRPFTSLEIGLSRAAQWCGEGRPCDLETFGDLLAGNDNRGDGGIGVLNEPGNQLAGVDFRWSAVSLGLPAAVYGQFIGEDEAGGFPSRYLGLLGFEGGGSWRENWSYRWFAEVADTSCGFYESGGRFNCAYNHSIYRSGYRYRGRPIGHGLDNDARAASAGLMLVDQDNTAWRILARFGDLNRGGAPDVRNSLTATPRELASIDLAHVRATRFGVIEIGAGIERMEDPARAEAGRDARAWFRWRSAR